jgi:hypothetical protein
VLRATEPVRATRLLGVGGRPGIFNWRAIEADALIALGRLGDAELALDEFEGAVPRPGLRSAALMLARCRGNLAVASGDAAQAAAMFERAHVIQTDVSMPFEHAVFEPRRRPPLAGGRESAGGYRTTRSGAPALLRPRSRALRTGLRQGTGVPAK